MPSAQKASAASRSCALQAAPNAATTADGSSVIEAPRARFRSNHRRSHQGALALSPNAGTAPADAGKLSVMRPRHVGVRPAESGDARAVADLWLRARRSALMASTYG